MADLTIKKWGGYDRRYRGRKRVGAPITVNRTGGRVRCRRCQREVYRNPDAFNAHAVSCVRLASGG